MHTWKLSSVVVSGMLVLLPVAAVADLLVADRYRDSVGKFSSLDGSLIQLDFISDASGAALDSAMEAQLVGDEIWVADQNLDAIDNIRGFHIKDNVLYVTNFGTANSAPGPCVRKFDATTGTNLGSVFPPACRSPWDVMEFQGRVLVSDDLNISTNPTLDTGAIFELLPANQVGVFASGSQATNGLSLPKQMIQLANGNLLVGNNGLPRALIEFNAAGQIVASYSTGSLRTNGLYELENGLIFVAGEDTGVLGTNGIYTLNRSNGQFTPLMLGNATPGGLLPHYVNYIAPDAPALCAGDLDCDGAIDFFDIDPFVLALGGEAGYLAAYPDCQWLNADCDGDEDVDFFDIDPFVALIGTTCP